MRFLEFKNVTFKVFLPETPPELTGAASSSVVLF